MSEKATIELELDGSDFEAELENILGQTKKLGKEGTDTQKKLQKEFDNSAKETNKFNKKSSADFKSVLSGVSGLIGGVLALGAAMKVVGTISDWGKAGIQGALEGEIAVSKLNNALKIAGEYSDETSKKVINWADALEKSTLVSAEAIQQQVSFSLSLGKTLEQSQYLTEVALDLSKALDQDLNTSMNQLMGTLNGVGGPLAKRIPEIKNMTEAQLKAGDAVKFFANRLNGEAATALDTLTGKTTRAKISIEDSAKAFGSIVVENKEVGKSIAAVGKLFDTLSGVITNNSEAINNFISYSLGPFVSALNAVNTVIRRFTATGGENRKMLSQLGAEYNKNKDEIDRLQKALDKMPDNYTWAIKRNKAEADLNTLLERQNVIMVERQALRDKGVEAATVPGVEKVESKKANRNVDFTPENEPGKIDNAEIIAQLAYTEDARTKVHEKFLEQQGIEQGLFQSTQDFKKEIEQLQTEGKISQYEADIALLGEQKAVELAMLEDKMAQTKNLEDQRALEHEINQKRQAAATDERIKLEIQQEQAKRAAVMGILSNMSTLMQSSNRKAFEIGKAAAISQTLINTYMSATAAFSSVVGIPIIGPALATAAAAAAVASGLMQVDRIKSQQPPKAEDGGWLNSASGTGISYTGDKNMFQGNDGEVILNKREQRVINSLTSGGGFASPIAVELLSTIANRVNTAPVVYLNTALVSNEIQYENDRRISA